MLDQRTNETFSDRGQTRTFSFVNTNAYKYYRFDVSANNGAAELQLAEWELFGQIANLVPSPIAGTVSASSGTKPSPTAEVSTQAFDANSATKWLLFNPTGFLQYQFENSTANVVNQYSLTSANDEATRDPKDWRILGSNDGTNFVELDKRTGQSFSDRKQTRSFSFVNTTAYKFYKLDVTANNGATDILQLADWQLFGLQPTTANQPISNVYVITVPEGQQTFNLPLNAIDDLVAEGTETIEVTLVAHDDTKYRVAPDPTQSKVTMSLIDDEQAGIEIKSVSYVDKFQEFKAAATNPLSTVTSQTSLTFADLDRDSDVDGFGIDAQGKAHFFENTDASAAKNTPQFTENETKNPLKGITGSQIVFADLDRDGRGIVDVGTGANVRTAIVDGDLDALAVQADGSVIYYENADTSELRNTPNFQRNDVKNSFAGKNLGVGSKLNLVDVEFDGDLDAVVVRADGKIDFYENTDTSDRKNNPTFAAPNPSTNPFKDIQLQAGSNLGFDDIDRDGEPDAFSVKADGTIAYYENVSTFGGKATFVTNTNSDMSPFKVQTVATNGQLQFADLNGDKDLDAIVTSGTNSRVLENITVPQPVFTQNLNRINTHEDGSKVSFGVRLSTKPTANVTLSIQGVDATEVSFDKTTLNYTPDNWDKYQVVNATGVDDNISDRTVHAVRINGTSEDTFYKSTAAVLLVSNADNDQELATGTSSSIQDNTLPQVTVNALNKTTFTVGLKATQAYDNGTIGLQLDVAASASAIAYTLTKGTQLTFGSTKVEILQDINISNAGASIAAVKLVLGTAIAKDATGSFNLQQARFPEALSLAITQAFDSTSGVVGLRVNQADINGVTLPSYLLTAGTILTFGVTTQV
ncbi:MAG: VCBS repeat-containing protein [Pseudanabaena sp. ELA645]